MRTKEQHNGMPSTEPPTQNEKGIHARLRTRMHSACHTPMPRVPSLQATIDSNIEDTDIKLHVATDGTTVPSTNATAK